MKIVQTCGKAPEVPVRQIIDAEKIQAFGYA